MKKNKKIRAKIHSNKIKEALKENDSMTQQELSDLVGTTKEHISKIINHKSNGISLAIAMKISEVLKRPIEELFSISKKDVVKK